MDIVEGTPLAPDELVRVDKCWRAANYLSVGQIYLLANPLLTEPLAPEHVKPRLLGHWGTTPGLNLVYPHLTRAMIDRVPGLGQRAAGLRQDMVDARIRHRQWIREHGEDMPEIRDWTWAR
jgi:phosphoketolase